MRWFNAVNFCFSRGGYLVDIDNEDENNFVVDLVRSENKLIEEFWISLNDLAKEDHFVLSDHGEPNFFNWINEQPKYGDCTVIWQKDGKWRSEYCFWKKYPFVCENSIGEFIYMIK